MAKKRRVHYTPHSPLRRVLATLAAAVLLAVCAFAVIRFAPVYLPSIDQAAGADAAPAAPGPQRVFVHDRLTWAPMRLVVIGRPAPTEPARLEGFRQAGAELMPAPDAAVDGRVIEVNPRELRRIDRYERVGEAARRDLVDLTDGEPAWVYRPVR